MEIKRAPDQKEKGCGIVISMHFYLINTWLTCYTNGTTVNGFVSDWENELVKYGKKQEGNAWTGKKEKARKGWRHRCLSEPSGQRGFLSINALVSSWKWNNKWAFRTLSGLFHAWMFSLNFSVNPLGKQWGIAVESGKERDSERARYKERDKTV